MSAQQSNQHDNTNCIVCNRGNGDDLMLLCDNCDRGFHTYCLNIQRIPQGNWYCPACIVTSVIPEKPKEPKPTVVHIYERVSSKGQNQPEYGRVGLNTQNDTTLQFCIGNGFIVSSTVTEEGSAYKLGKNPKLVELIKRVKNNEPIIVYSFNRFSRNATFAMKCIQTLHTKGSYVWSVMEDKTSKDPSVRTYFEAAESESKQQSDRIKATYKRRRTQGSYIGPKPFGYNIISINGNRKLRENIDEQRIARRIRQLHGSGVTPKQLLAIVSQKYPMYRWNQNKLCSVIYNRYENKFTNCIIKNDPGFETSMIESLQTDEDVLPSELRAIPEEIKGIVFKRGFYYFKVKWVESNDETLEPVHRFFEDVPEFVTDYIRSNRLQRKALEFGIDVPAVGVGRMLIDDD